MAYSGNPGLLDLSSFRTRRSNQGFCLAAAGGKLLQTLADSGIFLSSACGGGGTCAMCECHVYEGGGDVLPTEMNHLTRKEAAEHKRLACQVKVRQDPAHAMTTRQEFNFILTPLGETGMQSVRQSSMFYTPSENLEQ